MWKGKEKNSCKRESKEKTQEQVNKMMNQRKRMFVNNDSGSSGLSKWEYDAVFY